MTFLNTMEDAVGWTAAVMSTVAGAPQLYSVRKLGSTKDLNVKTQLLYLISSLLWTLYGYLLGSVILIVECAVVSCIYVLILLAIWRDFKATR